MILRTLLLVAGCAAVGHWLLKVQREATLPRSGDDPWPAPADDGLDPAHLPSDLPLRSLQAGMPSDMHSDADRARPGFADYARGA